MTVPVGVTVTGVPVGVIVPVVGVAVPPTGVPGVRSTVTVISRGGDGETWANAVGMPSAFISGLT